MIERKRLTIGVLVVIAATIASVQASGNRGRSKAEIQQDIRVWEHYKATSKSIVQGPPAGGVMSQALHDLQVQVETARQSNIDSCLSIFRQELQNPDHFAADARSVAARDHCIGQIPKDSKVYRQGKKRR